MNQNNEMLKSLSNRIDGFNMHLVYIQDILAVYNHIIAMKNDLLTNSDNFTLITGCALYDSLTMALSRLYDKSKEAETIQNLLDRCLINSHLLNNQSEYKEKIESFKSKLENDEFIAPAISTISLRRDKMFAHNDKQFFGKKISSDKSYLPMYQIWFLVDFTKEVLTYLSENFNLVMPTPKYDNDILNSLKLAN